MPAGNVGSADVIAPSRFSLTVDGVEIAQFSQLVSITSEVEPGELVTALLKKLPGKRNPPTVVLSRGMSNDAQMSAWHEAARRDGSSEAKKSAALIMYDATGKPVARYHLESAWPSKIEIGALKAGASEVLMETVTIACDGLQRLDD
jgi:phage tail-like protein